MKINNKVLSIPPYVSTSWNNIRALRMKGMALVVVLQDGENIEIPGLKPEIVGLIFSTHASSLEGGNAPPQIPQTNPFAQAMMQARPSPLGEAPFKLSFASMDEFGSMLQHNPQQAHAPELPKEILSKIAQITKIVAPEDAQLLPKAEPHCNCMHCQIARAVNQENTVTAVEEPKAAQVEEEVKDDELQFQQWEIQQIGDNLFSVTNKLDRFEIYNVHIGKPIGCTCGKEGCEHIVAVLKS